MYVDLTWSRLLEFLNKLWICDYRCSLLDPHKSAVVLFDRGYPSFRSFDSAIPIYVVGMKSYMDSLFDPNATCKPKIWKRYVDETFAVWDRDHFKSFLPHLKRQQPTIPSTMEIEKDHSFFRHNSYKGLRRSSHYHCLQKAHPHWPVPSLWLTPPSVSEEWYG